MSQRSCPRAVLPALILLFLTSPAAFAQAPTAGQLIISEFRYQGPNGSNDDYVEIYNNTDAPITVQSADGSAGFGLFSSGNLLTPYCTLPNGTVIPARGHFLCAGSGYSLAGYPGASGGTAPDAPGSYDIPSNVGIGLFTGTTTPAILAPVNRLDAVGSSDEPNTFFREGTGFPPLFFNFANYALLRKLTTGRPQDTDNNETDFFVVDIFGTVMCMSTLNFQCQRLGAPGPENLSSPILRTPQTPSSLIAPCVSSSQTPNRVRDTTPGPSQTSRQGTLRIRRRFTNNTGAPVTRLRFRVTDMTTLPSPAGTADLRLITAPGETVTNPCTGQQTTVLGTTLEQPPTQLVGGGLNSTVAAGTITTGTPLAPGDFIDLEFVLGVQQSGSFRFFVAVEALP